MQTSIWDSSPKLGDELTNKGNSSISLWCWGYHISLGVVVPMVVGGWPLILRCFFLSFWVYGLSLIFRLAPWNHSRNHSNFFVQGYGMKHPPKVGSTMGPGLWNNGEFYLLVKSHCARRSASVICIITFCQLSWLIFNSYATLSEGNHIYPLLYNLHI